MDFEIVKAKLSDAAAISALIQTVYEAMDHKEWYVADNAEYTSNVLTAGNGTGYLAVEARSGELAGIFLVTFPGMSPENLGNDIGFSNEQMLLTAHMESAAVLPKYRGHHLQYRLMQAAEADLRKAGYRYLLCTIHPDNRYSKDNALRQGYQVIKTTEKYGGYLRDILQKVL
ncbi:MAG: GNAT family N-acetyltransferase [Eubacteriales bacterium]|nr:GNAT family N-acetyltransferase [Eubacteriales bacterium]